MTAAYDLTPSADRHLHEALAASMSSYGANASVKLIDGPDGTVLHIKIFMKASSESIRRAVANAARAATLAVLPDVPPIVTVFQTP